MESLSYVSEIEQPAMMERDASTRLEKVATVYQMKSWKVFRSRNLSRKAKMHVLRSVVNSVLLYGAETWPVTQHDNRRLKTFQIRCLQDIVGLTL